MVYGLEWLTGPSSNAEKGTTNTKKASDGGFVAPDRNKRELCYESRDLLFECLDKHDILDANKEDEKMRKVCATENAEYERDCARSWIKYFKEKRVVDYKRDLTLKQIQQEDAIAAAKAKNKRSLFG